jgi:hypothetical protein
MEVMTGEFPGLSKEGKRYFLAEKLKWSNNH